MGNDILLNSQHDIDISNLDLSIVSGADSVAQALSIRLQFFKAEWFLDTSVGIPFYTNIFVKNPNFTHIETLLKAEILSVENVRELLKFETEYIAAERKFVVNFEVNTTFGIITQTETLEI